MQKNPNSAKVYLKRINDWTSEETIKQALLCLWQQLDPGGFVKKDDFLGIKLSFGEEGSKGFIKPGWLSLLIANLKEKSENVFIVETNTLYRERRSNAVGHLHVANQHGFDINSLGIPIIIGDGLHGREGQNISIRGDHFENVKLAQGICESDCLLSLAHVTGHMQTGFAASLKNLGMGCASRSGKLQQHTKTLPEVTVEKCVGCGLCMKICPANAIGLKRKKAILVKERCIGCGECTIVCRSGAIDIKYDENIVKMQEKMVEYALGVDKAMGSRIACINFLCNITKNCDCMAKDEEAVLPDVGLIGGVDPVSVDKASMDILGIDNVKKLFPDIDPEVQIRHAEKIKLGSSQYELVEI